MFTHALLHVQTELIAWKSSSKVEFLGKISGWVFFYCVFNSHPLASPWASYFICLLDSIMDDDMFLELLCAGVSHQDETGADSIPTDSDMSDGNDIFMLSLFLTFMFVINPLSANPTKWSNTYRQFAFADELFECVWPFCGVGT